MEISLADRSLAARFGGTGFGPETLAAGIAYGKILAANDNDLSDTALEIGTEIVCKDVGQFAAWVDAASPVREHSAYFGSISSTELVQLLMGGKAVPEQVVACAAEMRRRYLRDERPAVLEQARRACE